MSDDAAQDYLESGGTTTHPLDAANDDGPPTIPGSSSDPAQAYLESGGKTAHPLDDSDKPKDTKDTGKRRDKQTVTGGIQAAGSGLTSGVADVVGLPVDTARNAVELGKAGAGTLYSMATGRDAVPFGERLSDVSFENSLDGILRIKNTQK